MEILFSEISKNDINLDEIESLFIVCKWDWLENKVEMKLALKGSFRIYSATSAGHLIGFARIISDGKIYGLLVDCMVHPNFRRRGIGKGLVDFIVTDSTQSGLKVIQLLASSDGLPVYQKAGFMKCPESAPGMVKIIAE